MKYRQLKSISYDVSKDEYDELYHSRYNSDNTIQLNFEISGNNVFFMMIPSIYQPIINIHKLNTRIGELSQVLPKVALNHFSRRCLIDEIYISNDIEGVRSTRREIDAAIKENEIEDKRILNAERNSNKKVSRFHSLVKYYMKIGSHIDIPLKDCQDIRDLYDETVLQEVVSDKDHKDDTPDGRIFRHGPVSLESVTGKIIHEGITPEDKIIENMDKALDILNSEETDENNEIDLLIRIAIFHYLFGYIHPFYDGNGRLNRYISSYLLSTELNSLISYRLSYNIQKNRSKYYKAFDDANNNKNKGDITSFIIDFLSFIEDAMVQLYDALYKRYETLDEYFNLLDQSDAIGDKANATLFILIQSTLFSEEGITITELSNTLGVNRATADKRIKRLKNSKLIITNQVGREKKYMLNLDTLNEMIADGTEIK